MQTPSAPLVTTSTGDRSLLDQLPDGLADALALVVARCREDWEREYRAISAKADALIADLRRENAELRAELRSAADEQMARVAARLAEVHDGEPGPCGPAGPAGPPGEKGADGAGISAITREGTRIGFELTDGRFYDAGELPRGAKGETGSQGLPGRDGRDGAPGPAGTQGRDGRDGIDGKDGAPGRDGLGFDDILPPVYDGEGRTVTLRFQRGEHVRDLPLVFAGTTHYRGVWQQREYVTGDFVSWDGSIWHCNQATEERPGIGKAWTLAVKRGRDGKNGEKGERGPAGPAGKDGRDLTQMGPDGRKW